MSNKAEVSVETAGAIVPSVTWRKVVLLAVLYVLMELLLYKALSLYLRSYVGQTEAYLDWVYYFYFAEKKLMFFYFLLFLVSTWIFCFGTDIYLNFWIRREHELSGN